VRRGQPAPVNGRHGQDLGTGDYLFELNILICAVDHPPRRSIEHSRCVAIQYRQPQVRPTGTRHHWPAPGDILNQAR
jgi:hypothetical protein